MTQRLLAGLVVLGLVLACGPAGSPGELTVFAASSLTEAFREIGKGFEAANPGVRVTFNFGGSPQLRAQIEQGARADLFASANPEQMDLAVTSGLIAGTPTLFSQNKLTIVVPKTNPGRIEAPADLARPGIKIVLAQQEVPAGRYTRESLSKMTSEFGADFAGRVLRNVVSEEGNVRQVLTKVQLGEADAAIVYTTDVTPDATVQQIAIPDPFNVVATYPIARIRDSRQSDLADRFIAYVQSPAGQAILNRWGFLPPG